MHGFFCLLRIWKGSLRQWQCVPLHPATDSRCASGIHCSRVLPTHSPDAFPLLTVNEKIHTWRMDPLHVLMILYDDIFRTFLHFLRVSKCKLYWHCIYVSDRTPYFIIFSFSFPLYTGCWAWTKAKPILHFSFSLFFCCHIHTHSHRLHCTAHSWKHITIAMHGILWSILHTYAVWIRGVTVIETSLEALKIW